MTHPAPEVPCRLALAEEVPASAARLAAAGRENGWTVAVTYARGTDLDSDGTPRERRVKHLVTDPEQAGKTYELRRTGELVVVDSVAVRLQRAGERLAGVWVDGAYAFGLDARGRGHSASGIIERITGALCDRPLAARTLAGAVRDACKPRKLAGGVTMRTHAEACEHVAQRYGLELAQVRAALDAQEPPYA